MKNKKIIYFAILLITLLAISTVSASEIDSNIDNNDNLIDTIDEDNLVITDDTSGDSYSIEDLYNSNISENALISEISDSVENNDMKNSEKTLGATGTQYVSNFTQLNESLSKGGNITLKNNINFGTNYINITVSGTVLDGNYYTITGSSSKNSCIFVSARNVVIKNLKIQKNNKTSGNGSAIYWNGANGNLTGCTFINNTAYDSGGAVYWNGANGLIASCTFNGNKVNQTNKYRNLSYGGAVFWNGSNGTIRFSKFLNNLAYSNLSNQQVFGGAIYWNGTNGLLCNSNFTNNNATTVSNTSNSTAGGVYWKGNNGMMNNCSFINNKRIYVTRTYHNILNSSVYWDENAINGSYGVFINQSFYTIKIPDFSYAIKTVWINGTNYTANYNKEFDISNLTKLGDYILTSEYSTSEYTNLHISQKFSLTDNVNITANNISYGNDENITLRFREKINNTVYFYLNSAIYSVNVSNGRGNILIPQLNVGSYNIRVSGYVHNNTTFSVLKSNITVSPINITFGNSEYISISTTNKKLEMVTLLVNGERYNVSLLRGSGSIYLYNLTSGNYTVNIDNRNTSCYNYFGSYSFVVNKANPNLYVYNISNHTYGDKTVIKFYMDARINDNVIIQIGNDIFNVDVEDGKCEFTVPKILDAGKYNATVNFVGNKNFISSRKITSFNITKDILSVSFDKSNIVYLDNVNIILSKKVNGTINFLIDGLSYNIKLIDGKGGLPSLNAGQHSIKISNDCNSSVNYFEDKLLVCSNNYDFLENIFTVNKINTKVSFIIEYNKDYDIINVCLSDVKNNKLGSRWVYVTDERDGWSHKLYTGFDGSDYKNITKLIMGNHPITVRFDGDDNHNGVSTTFEVTVNKLKTIMVDNKLTYYVGVKNKYLTITLKDQNGKIIKNQKVTLTVNKKSYTATTNKNGVATFKNFNIQKAGTYKATVKYAGIYNYYGTSLSTKIVVYKKASALTVPKKTFKKSAKTKKLTITLKSGKTLLKKKLIKVTINKKTYKAKTNNKGVATVNIKLTKKGTYNVVTKFAGDNTYKASTKKSKVVIK